MSLRSESNHQNIRPAPLLEPIMAENLRDGPEEQEMELY